jgi:hypothetical protein
MTHYRMAHYHNRHKRFTPELGWDEFKDPQISDWKRVRGVIEHENGLVNNRITWLLASHGFLFTILGLSANNELVASCFRDPRIPPVKGALVAAAAVCNAYKFSVLPLLMLLGLVISLIIAITISHAEKQVRAMDTWWDRRYGSTAAQDSHPAVFRPRPTLFLGFLFRYSLLASAFAATWGAGLLYLLVRRVDGLQAFFGDIAPIWYVLAMQLALLSWYLGCGRAETDQVGSPARLDYSRLVGDWYFLILLLVFAGFAVLALSASGRPPQGCFGLGFTGLSLVLLEVPRWCSARDKELASGKAPDVDGQHASGNLMGHH